MAQYSLKDCSWFPFNDEPLLSGNWYVPRFCDPQVIIPTDSPDGKWHMFVHSWIGIHHFKSDSGIAWEPEKMVVARGHYPFIFREDGHYVLLYEKHDYNIARAAIRRANERNENCSRIEMRVSQNLVSWSEPVTILDSRNIAYAHDYVNRANISRPQLIKINNVYRLYFGASEVTLLDTKEKTGRYVGYAESVSLNEPFELKSQKPLLEPQPDDEWTNMACGSFKIVQHEDEIQAIQCGYYWNPDLAKTGSAAFVLTSEDGLHFTRCGDKPIIMPQNEGWADTYIKNCDVNFMPDEKCWYCYFSACNKSKGVLTKESVGLFIGNYPQI